MKKLLVGFRTMSKSWQCMVGLCILVDFVLLTRAILPW